ncbi:MAG TPA: AgmX/PglI C-terminal domain-containing protein [Polyangiaceae bacterium]|nr:AgmX/PglI C-terminal domain-containing protein [Polyangiaceae bacterium]
MTTTTPPPPQSSNRPFIIAMLLMLVAIAALVVYKCSSSGDEPRAQLPPEPVATAAPIPDHVVPPPPPIASANDAGATQEPAKKTVVQSTYCATCGKCTGTEAPNFRSIVRGRAGAAQRCYEKALSQQDQLQGKLTVNLCVGVGGGVCGASIASDSLGSPLVSQCVLNIFRATVFPSPKNGCVDAQVPLNFVPQKQ